MSIVLFQNSLVLNDVTESTFNNQNVTDTDTDVSNGAITTQSAGETIFKADFGVKKQYELYNYTAGNTEATYDAVTRIAPRFGFASNPLFAMQVAFLKYVPLIVRHIDPQLFENAEDRMFNMTHVDYYYIISYPTYSGFKVQHDPTYTAYVSFSSAPATKAPSVFGLILIGGVAAAVIIGAVAVFKRRKPKTLMEPSAPPAP
jgi:hypothetical protein